MRLRKSNGLPGNEVLVPMTPVPKLDNGDLALKQPAKKRAVIRKKKDVNNS